MDLPSITVLAKVGFVSEDQTKAALVGFGFIYADNKGPVINWKKGDMVHVKLRSWSKKREDNTYIQRFYVKDVLTHEG